MTTKVTNKMSIVRFHSRRDGTIIFALIMMQETSKRQRTLELQLKGLETFPAPQYLNDIASLMMTYFNRQPL